VTDTDADASPTFAELALPEPLQRALADVGYETPTPIQAQAIPPLLEGRDLLGVAQTGTGKTAAFVLPLLGHLDLTARTPQLLVLTPTRELAVQVAEAVKVYGRYLKGLRILPVYGGQGMGYQLKQLERGVHVVVGTPGRVLDHLKRGTLVLDGLAAAVLDEADEMLRMGFLDEVTEILDAAPAERQTALFSATMPPVIRGIAERAMQDPVSVEVASKTRTVETVRQRAWQVRGASKLEALTRILQAEDIDGVLVFARTKNATAEISERLEARGFASACLNGDMNQAMRERTVDRFKEGKIDVLVATDVAARGLDVERISHVINHDIPWDTESYVHRIGRTGRAGRTGEAILFFTHRERRMLHNIQRNTRQKFEMMRLPTRQDISLQRVERFKQEVGAVLEGEDLGDFQELVAQLQKESQVDLIDLAAGLAFLAQKERPLDLGAPDEPPPPPAREARETRETRKPRGGNLSGYKVQVGREHGLRPGNLVGALTNEGGLSPGDIGRIEMRGAYSFVELPADLDDDDLFRLGDLVVQGERIQVRPAEMPNRKRFPGAPRPSRHGHGHRRDHRRGPRHPKGRGPAAKGRFRNGPPRRKPTD
jgi:ATP-dependent RNA helicase DeaD